MRLADYVMSILEKNRVQSVFMLSGGGIMYLVDALGHSDIHYVCCHHEQAAGIAAQAYAMEKNELGVCMVTTGPGGTNALTAAGAAYVDSTPMLFISGQVKMTDFASLRNVRQFGAQENDIISMAKPITKYAVTVLKAEEIKYHMEKAIYLATHGRKGPVWIDIPLDIQNAQINPDILLSFDTNELQETDVLAALHPDKPEIRKVINTTYDFMQKSKRPLFLVGHGVIASDSQNLFEEVQSILKIPVLSTWRALEIMDYDDPYFFGSPGLQANRYSNIILQGADLLIVLGSRMDNMITAFNEEHFAYQAKKIVVDIDDNEIKKLAMTDILAAVCDVKFFLENLKLQIIQKPIPDYSNWIKFCQDIKREYPLLNEKQEVLTEMVDLYRMSMKLSDYCDEKDIIVVSSTSRCNTAGHMAFKHKKGQRVISSMGFGSMGFALPSVVGSWFSGKGQRIIMLEGDGSLQLNIQELQTVVHYKINAKMFIFHNAGYAAIATMQNRNFNGFHVGSDAESGVTMPDLEKISAAYGIPYYCIIDDDEIESKIERALKHDGPVICEFIGSITYDEIPKCISYLDESGKRVSALLENPFPFLSEQTMEQIYARL
ncbi:MAG: thiamine pyrophosphate-binding protein [Clostridium sp.]|nr:thiamine pyrophosphate-binding protein [Clostridium sp.]